ncbi:MAG: fructosamine kinase family protein, partial [Gammaproteobacteria bacterium]
MSEMWQLIGHAISDATNSDVTLGTRSVVSGGCINQAYKIQAGHGSYFVKLNDAQLVAMFEAEFQGL